MLHNIPEEQNAYLHLGRGLKLQLEIPQHCRSQFIYESNAFMIGSSVSRNKEEYCRITVLFIVMCELH